jgi:hypothetical protein
MMRKRKKIKEMVQIRHQRHHIDRGRRGNQSKR